MIREGQGRTGGAEEVLWGVRGSSKDPKGGEGVGEGGEGEREVGWDSEGGEGGGQVLERVFVVVVQLEEFECGWESIGGLVERGTHVEVSESWGKRRERLVEAVAESQMSEIWG